MRLIRRRKILVVELFDEFCDGVIDQCGLADRVEPVAATAIGPDGACTSTDGRAVSAEHVVMTHGERCVAMPSWAADSTAEHADRVDLSTVEPDSRVVIVGGGITAAHLAIAARARGASVRLICRRDVVKREFDNDPGWLGRNMQEFVATDDLSRRVVVAARSRPGSCDNCGAWRPSRRRSSS